jgi:AcrR family transcriptional regulator
MMAESTRDRLLKTADDLFYRDGFHAVGIDRIISEVGVTKTTFYNHFESKEQLILKVLQFHDRWWRDTFSRMLRKHGGESPRGQLEAVFDVIDELLSLDEFNGCIFVNVAVEFPLRHDPIHQAAAEHKREMELILRDLAMRAGAKEPASLAQQIAMLMEGCYVTAQVSRARIQDCTALARQTARLLLENQFAEAVAQA